MTPSTALALDRYMIVRSDLLGPLSVTAEELIDFPSGLLGFPECRSFILIASEREGLYWLQSLEHSALTFLLADPFPFFDGYSVDVGGADLADLQAMDTSAIVILAIVTLPRAAAEPCTANLQGPIALNLEQGLGKQVVLPDSGFGVRQPLELG